MKAYKQGMRSELRKFAPLFLAAAFAAPLGAGAVSVDDKVTTRPEPIQQHNGRDSVYGLSQDTVVYSPAKPNPERFGRAGGFTGSDRVELMNSSAMSDSGARILEPQSAAAPQASDSGAADSGRMTDRRFDNPDSAHGQDEGSMQTR